MSESTSFPSRLSPSDRLMWNIERDPVLRSPVVAIGLLDRDPDRLAVRATFQRAAERVPRLRQRITSGSGPFGQLQWSDDPDFSIDYHLRHVRAPQPADLRAVLDLAAPTAVSALDTARPLWECTIVEGLDDGRAAFILKFHHTMTDGVGGVDLASDVFDHTRNGRRARPHVAATPDLPPAPPSWMPFVAAGLAGVRAVSQPARLAADATRFVKSIARMLAPVPEPLSPLLLGRSLDRRLDTVQRPLAALRAAAEATGGTINDVFLAAVGGGLHTYHERLGHSVPALRVTMPINLRAEGDPPGGNRFTPARFVLPIDDPDAAARAQRAGAIARRWRDEPAVHLTDVLAAILDRVPAPLVTRFFGAMLKNVDVDVANVPGLRRPAYLGGAKIERLWAFAPPTGAALSVTLLSHVDTACIGVLSDVTAVADPALLVSCLTDAFDEVVALGATTTPASTKAAS
jgi:WS/DGAT/MGAT family acyltransferase